MTTAVWLLSFTGGLLAILGATLLAFGKVSGALIAWMLCSISYAVVAWVLMQSKRTPS